MTGSDDLSTAGNITVTGGSVNGGTLDLSGLGQDTSGQITFGGGLVQNGTLTSSLLPFAAQSGAATAVLSGTAGLTKTTTGVMYLTNSNNNYGNTTISGGTLGFANGALGSTGNIGFSGGVLQYILGNTQDVSARFLPNQPVAIDTNGNNVSFGTRHDRQRRQPRQVRRGHADLDRHQQLRRRHHRLWRRAAIDRQR